MRIVALILFSIAVSSPDSAGAQNEPAARDGGDAPSQETPEEIVVRGKRLVAFRLEVELARERAYDLFNEINSNDDFDIQCTAEQRTGTRLGRQVCAARFEGRISSRAGKDYLSALRAVCNQDPGGLTQDCMFSGASSYGIAAAQATESEAPIKRDLLHAEIHRLARENLEFGQAILDFYDTSLKYQEERKRPRGRRRER